jgi:COP9 signalosome complex subunit 7
MLGESEQKIVQYVLLAKSARGLALEDLIMKATADTDLHVFGELLALPNVQEVRRPDRLECA